MIATLVSTLQAWLFEQVVQPLLFHAGAIDLAEKAFDLTEWVVIGALETVLLAVVFTLLERRWPVEPVLDRPAIRTDVLYTLLHRLGLFAFATFALIDPAVDAIEGWLRLQGLSRPQLDQLWPGLTDIPVVSFLLYLVVLDFADYWLHRAEHRVAPLWALHAVHHSQRQMTFWSDSRNHLLSSLLRDVVMALLAVFVGVAPGQFVLLVVVSRLCESLQHANLRWRFGGPFESLLVSPSFHRRHHAMRYGHEGPARGINFAVLFPLWDRLFGTFDPTPGFVPTGIEDQLAGRDYGRGFWAQQWRGLLRLAGRP